MCLSKLSIFAACALAIVVPNRALAAAVATNEAAVQIALQHLGDESRYNSVTVKVIQFHDVTIPFLATPGISPAWRVQVKNLQLTYPDSTLAVSWLATVVIDSASGSLLRVDLLPNGSDTSKLFREPTSEEATNQIAALGEEFHGLPEEQPDISLLEALRAGMPYTILARHVVVWYVIYSYSSSIESLSPRPAWVIYMRGTPPVSSNPTIPAYMTTHRRAVIDAQTGKSLMACNIPYPDLESER